MELSQLALKDQILKSLFFWSNKSVGRLGLLVIYLFLILLTGWDIWFRPFTFYLLFLADLCIPPVC